MEYRHTWGAVAAGLLALLVAVACGPAPRLAATPAGGAEPAGRVTVFAASSLANVFREIGAAFQRSHPGVTVEFNFAASSALAAQLDQGAPADVFASADTANMAKAIERSLIEGAPVVFANNRPVIVVPADNRGGIASAKDLAKPGTKIVLAAPDVPIGNYARQIIDRLAGDPALGASFREAVMRNVVSNEANVRAVLAKVELGEADAGIVYRTDALVSGAKVTVVAVPEAANVIASYPAGVVKATRNRPAADAFLRFLTGPEARALLKAAGFDPGA